MSSTDHPDAATSLLVRASGVVQGVGYRFATVREAQRLGVTGWVRNRLDGSVEAHLQGAAAQVRALCDWMRRGPPGAHVTGLHIEPAAPDAQLRGFEQRPTA